MFLLQTLETETREFLDWGAPLPPWVIILLVIPAAGLFATFFYKRERPVGGGRSWIFLAALRTALLLAIVLFLCQPMLRRITYQTRDPHLVVLVDDSLSMQEIADKYSDREVLQKISEVVRSGPPQIERTSRYDLVRQLLYGPDTAYLESLRGKLKISLYTFASASRRMGEAARHGRAGGDAELPKLPASSEGRGDERVKQTKLGDSIREALADVRGLGAAGDHGVVGFLILTDGQSNGGVVEPEEAAAKLKQLGIPALVVGVGNPDPPKNIRVVNLDVSDMVLVGDRVPFDGTIIADGYEGQRVQVDLLVNGEVVETDYVVLAGEGEAQTVRVEHRPERKGDAIVSFRVEVLGGELFEEDNLLSRPIKILDEKIKVLLVDGPPRWEYRYLKNALVRDPTMEAHIFLMSADADFRQESSPGVAPLRYFPSSAEELFQYHVVIIGDVHPKGGELTERRLSREQLELIESFVSDAGGGVIFIAGEQANPHLYLNTPLYPLLPVDVSELGRAGDGPIKRAFNVKLTGPGKEHPILRIVNDQQENAQLWENDDGIPENHLPGSYWFARASKLKLGAIALAVHPEESHPIHGPRVIFAVQSYGKGRTFFSAIDSTWRWRAGVDNLYFYRFWGQAIRYVASGRLLGQTPRYTLSTDKQIYTIGGRVNIDAKVFDANMKPLTDPSIVVYHSVQGRDGEAPRSIELIRNPVKSAGTYDGTLVAGQLGSHELWLGTESERLAFRNFTVEVPPLEFRDPRMNREGLKKVARLSEGKYYDLYEFTDVVGYLDEVSPPRQVPVKESQDDLWDDRWVLFLFTGVIAAEWILRKVLKLL